MPPRVWHFVETADNQEGPTSAWHRLGKKVPLGTLPSIVAEDIIKYDVFKWPAGYQRPDGEWIRIPSKYHLVREAVEDRPEAELGYIAEGYHYMSARKLFSQLDPIAKDWPLETAGVLGNGESIFMLFKVGDTEINSDPMSEYFLVNEVLNGENGLNIAYVNIRVVCQNTLDMALKDAVTSIQVRHVGDYEEEFLNVTDLMLQLGDAKDQMRDMLLAMTKRRIDSEEQLFQLLEATVPLPKQPKWLQMALDKGAKNSRVDKGMEDWEVAVNRALRQQAVISEELAKLDEELQDRAGSLYNFTQAVAAWADHRQERDRKEGLAMAAATGYRADAKHRAMKAAIDLLKN